MAEIELDDIRYALAAARRLGCTEVSLESGDTEFEAVLGASAPPVKERQAEVAQPAQAEPQDRVAITSPFVGFLKEASKPLQPGTKVAKGDVIAEVAALGLANEVSSSVAGEVIDVLVEPGNPVEYGQPIAYVRVLT